MTIAAHYDGPPYRQFVSKRGRRVEIRQAERTDATDLVTLVQEVGAEPEGWILSTGGGRREADERRYLRAYAHNPDALLLVAECEGRVVGRLNVHRDLHAYSPHVGDLGMMILDGYRGEGIGRALLEGAMTWAPTAGIHKLELHVFGHNTRAIALYDALGFVREGLRRRHFQRGGVFLDAILMARAV